MSVAMIRNASARLGPLLSQRMTVAVPIRGMSTFEERERGEERVYFRKEDERILRKLLEKVKAHADQSDTHEATGAKAAELSQLKGILGKYKVSDEDYEALIKWRHSS